MNEHNRGEVWWGEFEDVGRRPPEVMRRPHVRLWRMIAAALAVAACGEHPPAEPEPDRPWEDPALYDGSTPCRHPDGTVTHEYLWEGETCEDRGLKPA